MASAKPASAKPASSSRRTRREEVGKTFDWSVETALCQCYEDGMDRGEAIGILKAHEGELKRLGIERLYMFGSTIRGDARPGSDIDLFFDHEKGSLGLFELMDVKARAAAILGHPADIMTRRSLHPRLKERIEESAILVF